MTAIVIGIPTFRRARQLDILLTSLAPEVAGTGATIVVADNGCEAAALAVAERHGAHYAPVPQRGLAAVRNALIAEAGWVAPGWTWLAMLDDDGWVTPGWLTALVGCGARFGADLVGGQVDGDLPPDAGRLAGNSVYAGRRRGTTGPAAMLGGAQNLLIGRALVERIGPRPFRAAYDRSGGEDYDFFRRAVVAGARMAWCAEAVVVEPVPRTALSPRRLLARYFSTGLYMARIDRSFDGAGRTWAAAAKGFVGAAARGAAGTLRGDWDAAARSALLVGHFGGRIAGLLGATSARYG